MEGMVRKEREEPEQQRPEGFGKEEGPHPLSVRSSWPLRGWP